jgi:DNA-binding beta-propeller fold protein YncE
MTVEPFKAHPSYILKHPQSEPGSMLNSRVALVGLRSFPSSLFISALTLLLTWPSVVGAQGPTLPYEVDADFFQLPKGWNFGQTPGAAVKENGNIVIFTRDAHALLEFDSDGKFIRELAHGQFEGPHGLRIDRHGNIWTTDTRTHLVLKMDQDGRVEMVLGIKGQAGIMIDTLGLHGHRFNMPTDVAFDSLDNIYVSDGYGNSRIVKFAPDGVFLKAWGEKGDGPGQFSTPHSIWVDGSNRVWVADRDNSRIQIFDTEGSLIKIWDEVGRPWGFAPAHDGHVWMADGTANRIVKLDLSGNILGSFGRGGRAVGSLGWAHYLVELEDGSIIVAEIVSHRPQRFVRTQE